MTSNKPRVELLCFVFLLLISSFRTSSNCRFSGTFVDAVNNSTVCVRTQQCRVQLPARSSMILESSQVVPVVDQRLAAALIYLSRPYLRDQPLCAVNWPKSVKQSAHSIVQSSPLIAQNLTSRKPTGHFSRAALARSQRSKAI